MDRAIVLTYHNIGRAPRGARLPGLYVSPAVFHLQMRYLKAAGFTIVALAEIVNFINGNSSVKRPVALTFDDGFADFSDNAWPVLKSLGFPVTVFIVTQRVGGENLWDCEYLNVRKRLLDWDSIVRLKDEGVSFASHTMTHPSLSSLTGQPLHEEIFGSKAALEERLNAPVDYFCYPYGDFNQETVESVQSAGFKAAFTTRKGAVFQGTDPFEINRISVKSTTGPLAFAYKLHLYNGSSRRQNK
ncbi:MAG: polysaccharide deacetylase family protein [Nitrospirae bacterium]|nr:polysaccharide deacetylase family protein [Nitrospirota bacterium]